MESGCIQKLYYLKHRLFFTAPKPALTCLNRKRDRIFKPTGHRRADSQCWKIYLFSSWSKRLSLWCLGNLATQFDFWTNSRLAYLWHHQHFPFDFSGRLTNQSRLQISKLTSNHVSVHSSVIAWGMAYKNGLGNFTEKIWKQFCLRKYFCPRVELSRLFRQNCMLEAIKFPRFFTWSVLVVLVP